MKYLPIRELENVANALNFRTSDCRVEGGCDLYTTKAASDDKKLYKNISRSLETQHESLLLLSHSIPSRDVHRFNINLDRGSPFGHLGKVSSRRTFAYMIATLNASHPDYEFSNTARPKDFRRETNLTKVMAAVDETFHNLRPRPTGSLVAKPANLGYLASAPQTPGGTTHWSPRMWKSIDKEMDLQDCEIYRYAPDNDPFDDEESAIWSMNYFFFNKDRRRVFYIHFRGLSLSHHHSHHRSGPVQSSTTKRARPVSRSLSFGKTGAAKRARYWLGDKADQCVSEHVWGEDAEDDDADDVIAEPGDDDETDNYDYDSEYLTDSEEEEVDQDLMDYRFRSKSPPRAVSESIAEQIDI